MTFGNYLLSPFEFGMFWSPRRLLVSGGAVLSLLLVVRLQGQSTELARVAQVGYKMFILISSLLLC